MATAGDLRDHIKSDLIINGTDYDAQILNAIHSALRAFRGKQFWFLEEFDTLTTTVGQEYVTLPTDYSAPGEFELLYSGARMSDGYGFDLISFPRLRREFWTMTPLLPTVPQACAVYAGRLYLSSKPDAAYTIDITYYKQDATLPAASQTSLWFDEGYDAVRAMAQYIFKRDAQGYTASEEDGALADAALRALGRTHENRNAGRH